MARQPRKRLTHFLCIPLATRVGRPQLADSLAAFRADVAMTPVPIKRGGGGGSDTTRGILPPTAVRPVGTLHLTLGVMSLDAYGTGPNSVQQAKAVLAGLGSSQGDGGGGDGGGGSDGRSIKMSLRGLHAMQPPGRASVLYAAPVDASTGQPAAAGGPLLALCERVRAAFGDFLVDDGRPLLLHATIVNTVYVRGGGGGRGRGGDKLTFDARDLLDRYDDYVWMDDVPVDTVALCEMGAEATAVDDDGDVVDAAYPVEAEVQV